jgi:radical SAM superfamily enzyme YgiQ (UPF0313 family)
MRVALIELGATRPELHEPLGIETLAGYLDINNCDTKCDLFSISFGWSKSLDTLVSYDVIGLSGKLGTWDRLVEMLHLLDSKNKLLIVGDIYGTYLYENVLKEANKAICVVGYGEKALCDIVTLYKQTSDTHQFRNKLAKVPNIAYMNNGSMLVTKRDYGIIMEGIYPRRDFAQAALSNHSQVQIEGSRGCPWSHCSFCSIPSFAGNKWLPYSVGSIVSQLIELSKLGVLSPYFTDADFIGNDIVRINELCSAIKVCKSDGLIDSRMNFYINLQVNGVLGGSGIGSNEECLHLLQKLHGIGVREVFIGIESGNKSQVRRYAKASTNNRNILAIQRLHELGFQTDIGFIMFDPLTSLEELESNMLFINECELNNHPSRLTKAMRIQPDTTMAGENNLANTKLHLNNASYQYRFADERVQKVYEKYRCYERKHLNYQTLVQGVAKGECNEDERKIVRAYLGDMRKINLKMLSSLLNWASNGFTRDDEIEEMEKQLEQELLLIVAHEPFSIRKQMERFNVVTTSDKYWNFIYPTDYIANNVTDDPVLCDKE